jgi:hypothetical protein
MLYWQYCHWCTGHGYCGKRRYTCWHCGLGGYKAVKSDSVNCCVGAKQQGVGGVGRASGRHYIVDHPSFKVSTVVCLVDFMQDACQLLQELGPAMKVALIKGLLSSEGPLQATITSSKQVSECKRFSGRR